MSGPAVRKRGGQSHLRNRVVSVGSNQAQAMGQAHPVGTAATPMVMPLALVTVYPAAPAGQYATVAYQDLTPIWTTDGAAVPASSPGTWGQLRSAGQA